MKTKAHRQLQVVDIAARAATRPVPNDMDDAAIWNHPTDPTRSVIFGTDKEYDVGGLYVFDSEGEILHSVTPVDRPNNVDVACGFMLGGQSVDVVVLTERGRLRLRVFVFDPTSRTVREVTGATRVFADDVGDHAEPMGVALYKRPRDSALFAVVSRKNGPREGYLGQYLLVDDGHGMVDAREVRTFGAYSGTREIEAIAVDHEYGFIYYADEQFGIRKYHADPDHPDAHVELDKFGTDGYEGDREGLAIYTRDDGTGYLISTDQRPGNSHYLIYDRAAPHELLKIVRGGADKTDGIDVTSLPFGGHFPHGVMVVMNSCGRNLMIFDWDDIAETGQPRLASGR